MNLPGKEDFFEKLVHTTFNTIAKRAVLTHHVGRPGKPAVTRMELVDLEQGKVLANAIGDGSWTAMAVHDDGEQVVVRNDDKNSQGQMGTVRLSGKKIVPLDLWTPYAAMKEDDKEKIVRFASFVNDDRLLTLSQNGQVVLWNFETRKPVRRFHYHGACQPSLTYDRKHLAICGGDLLGFVNLEDEQETPSIKAAPGMNYWLNSCFSPSCKRFAAATMSKLMIWDVELGDVLFEGQIPGLPTNGKLFFPAEDFVMINEDKLVEIASGIKLWQYQGYSTMVQGKTVFIHCEDKEGKLMEVAIPHDKALSLLTAAKAQSDLFVLKKGAPVSLDLSEVPPNYQGDVEASLKQQLEKKGFQYSESSAVSFKAKITGPTTEAVSYHFAGSFVVQKYQSNLNIVYDGKSIWSAAASNVPGAVSGRDNKAIKKQLDDAGRSPNLKFFGSANLPDYLQKPSGDGRAGNSQMLGTSKFTLSGLSD